MINNLTTNLIKLNVIHFVKYVFQKYNKKFNKKIMDNLKKV